MGGKGRILMSALTMAAGGNVTGSTGQMLQATTVNVIQSYGAQQIKLIADSMKSEVARTALQGILAGAGAAAQGQNATPAALGASASVVLNNLIDNSAYGESSSALSLAEREACKNLVTTLISGTTQALGGDAALANAAATIETENNSAAAATWGSMGIAGESVISGVVINEAALAAGGAAALITAPFVGSYYLMKEDVQNDKDAKAILVGDKSLEQVIAQRGRRCGQEVELKIMLKQLHGHMTLEEKLFLQETLSLLNYDISKRELKDLGRKYLPSGFQALNTQTLPTILPGRPIQESGPTILITPTAEPLPTVLPGTPIQEAKPTILVTPIAEAEPTVLPGQPIPEINFRDFIMEARKAGDGVDNRLPIPSTVTADNGLRVHSNERHPPGGQGFGSRVSIEPKNSQELFGKSVAMPDNTKVRYTRDAEGNIHRFSRTSEGLYHWSGSSADKKNPLKLEPEIKTELHKNFGWIIK